MSGPRQLPGRGVAVNRYVALGDSFTAGAEDSATARWADELALALEDVNPDVEYHNLAVPGVPSPHVVEHQLEPAVALRPDVVTVICGANDVLLSVRPDIGAYAATFDHILTRLRGELPETIVLTATVPDLSRFMPLRPRTRERVTRGMRQLGEVTRSVARRHDVHCMEWAEHPQAVMRDNFAGDGFHPSLDGRRRAAASVMRTLERLGVEVAPLEARRAS